MSPLFGKLRVEKNSTLIFPKKFGYFPPLILNLKYPSKKLWKIWGIEKCACKAQGSPSCNFTHTLIFKKLKINFF